ncbi:CRISPR-associated protein Cse2 [Skermanella aerolata KACC 11604]|nr:CRISPR-associated protein Cse2 [Skermanella aerolata KACC 11604]
METASEPVSGTSPGAAKEPTKALREPAKSLFSLARAFDDRDDRLGIGSGAVAELRRMRPEAGGLPSAFWHLALPRIEEDWIGSVAQEKAWAIVVAGMATMAPGAHARHAAPGAVLAASGYAESRFVRLLRAEGDTLGAEVRTVCLWFRNKGRAIDWLEFGRFVLARSGARFPERLDPDDEAHRMARRYFRELTRTAKENDNER